MKKINLRKGLKLSAIVLMISQMALAMGQPYCDHIGTRSEGWYTQEGLVTIANGNLAFDFCETKVATCMEVGSRSEGWYAFDSKDIRPVLYAYCDSQESIPSCQAQGTRSEGWYNDKGLIGYDNCAGKELKCMFYGTRSEGWYAVKASTVQLLQWDNCGNRN